MLLILPGVSSVCSKALSFDYKCSARVRQSLTEFWGSILQRANLRNLIVQTTTVTLKPEKVKQSEEVQRLQECFSYILENIHKNIRN